MEQEPGLQPETPLETLDAHEPSTPQEPNTRVIDGKIYTVVELEPVPVEVVLARDKVKTPHIGDRPMTTVITPFGDERTSTGRVGSRAYLGNRYA